MMEMMFMSVLMTFMGVLMGLMPVVITVVCYFLSRAEEKRSGQVLFSGKAAVIFTLFNNAAWLFAAAWVMILFNLIGDLETRSFDFAGSSFDSEPAVSVSKDWTLLRGGIALLICSGLAGAVLAYLWRDWTNSSSILPRDNIFVKCFSGLNLLVRAGLSLYLGTVLIFLLLQAMMDKVDLEKVGDGFKFPAVLLCCALAFLVANIRRFGSCSDAVVDGARSEDPGTSGGQPGPMAPPYP